MIKKLEINGVHAKVDDDLHKYVVKKIGKLDKYISRHARESAHAEVKLKENKAKDKKQYTCEIIMHLPHGTIATQETTFNMYAAVDIVEDKLKNKLKKYKETHSSTKIHRRVLNRLKRRSNSDVES